MEGECGTREAKHAGSRQPGSDTAAFIKDPDGNYRKRGRGRLRRGEEAVELTRAQMVELGLEK